MNVSNLLIGVIIVSMIAAGTFTFITELGAGNGFTAPQQINDTYNQMAEIESHTANMTSVFRTSSLAEAIGFFPKGVIDVIMLVPNVVKTATTMLVQMVSDLELPNFVLIGGGLILSISIVFAVVSMLARWPL